MSRTLQQISILQLKPTEENRDRRFERYQIFENNCLCFDMSRYELIHTEQGPYTESSSMTDMQILNAVYDRFNSINNSKLPKYNLYYGHSLSMSDIVVLSYLSDQKTREHHYYYIDGFGFKKLSNEGIDKDIESRIESDRPIRKELRLLEKKIIDERKSKHNELVTKRIKEIKELYQTRFEYIENIFSR